MPRLAHERDPADELCWGEEPPLRGSPCSMRCSLRSAEGALAIPGDVSALRLVKVYTGVPTHPTAHRWHRWTLDTGYLIRGAEAHRCLQGVPGSFLTAMEASVRLPPPLHDPTCLTAGISPRDMLVLPLFLLSAACSALVLRHPGELAAGVHPAQDA